MGCDIHLHVNYTFKEEPKGSKKKTYWRSFGDQFSLGRNYLMFGCMCQGVRTDIEGALEAKERLEPEDMSYSCFIDSVYNICSDEDWDDDQEKSCKLEDALKWSELYRKKIYYTKENIPFAVDDPDNHSYSWLTLKEYKKAIKLYNKNKENDCNLNVEYLAIKSLIQTLEKGGAITKLVFWFDN